MRKKQIFKKITKISLVAALAVSAVVPYVGSLQNVYASSSLVKQSSKVQGATGTVKPVENEYVGNVEKKIFSSAHFKVACTEAFSEIRLNNQKLGLSSNKWTDITLSNIKKLLKEGDVNKIEILFTDDIGGLYVGGSYEFIYDTTAPNLQLKDIDSNKYVIELGQKYFEEYTVTDNVSKEKDVKVDIIYLFNNNGNYEVVNKMDKVGNYTVWYNVCDEAGNLVERIATREVDVVDTKGPQVYPSTFVGSEVEGVSYSSYIDLKLYDLAGLDHIVINNKNRLDRTGVWNDANYINLKNYYRNNSLNTVEVFDVFGNSSTYSFVYDIDAPVLDIEYSQKTPTNQAVVVTIRAINELYNGYGGIKGIDGWTRIDNQTYQKIFEDNTSINDLVITDFAGNVSYIDIDVNNIDKTFAKTTLTYSIAKGEYTNGSVGVILKCDEEILTPDGWTKNIGSNGEVNFVKEFIDNGIYEFELQDLAGNKKKVVVIIDQIDRVAPIINSVENNGFYNREVTYSIEEEHLDYVVVDGIKYIENIPTTIDKEGKHEIIAVDKAGNETVIKFTIDKTVPEIVSIKQKYEAKQDGRIKVIATFNEPVKVKNTSLWKAMSVDENGYANEFYSYFYKTKEVTIKFEDRAANVNEYVFTVDMSAPIATVNYSILEPTRDNIKVTAVLNEEINEENLANLGWLKIGDKTFSKEYSQNVDEVIDIYDLVGNPGFIEVSIANIDKKVPEYRPQNWSITLEVDATEPNPYLALEQVNKVLEAQIQYISDDSKVTVAEDAWWNQNTSTLDIRKVGVYPNSFSFYITDAAGNRINPRLTVNVVDTTAPVIDLGDIEDITSHEMGTPFVDIDPKASDNSGEKILVNVDKIIYSQTQEGLEASTEYLTKVDVLRLGWYKLEYVATDFSGNTARVSRIVNVVDTIAPIYTVEYSTSELTYGAVTVTIKTEESAIIDGEGWSVDSIGKVFTKVYLDNGSEDVALSDASSNGVTVTIEVKNIVDKYWLEKFVEKCEELEEIKYTEVSWKAYYQVYQVAVEMLKLPHSQEEVDKMYENLVRAYLNLRLKPNVDTTAPICTIEYSISELTYGDVAVTIKTDEKAIIIGEGWNVDSTGKVFTKIYSTNVNEEVILKDAAGNATIVNIKIENIISKDLLANFIEKCKDLDETKYTENTWKMYYQVYQSAVEMLKVPHNQEEIDKMYKDIVSAYLELRLKPDADLIAPTYTIEYSMTNPTYDAIIVTIKADEEAIIVDEGWDVDSTRKVFTKVYSNNVNEEIILTDLAGNAVVINNVVENIINKDLLESFVDKCNDLDEAKYIEATWNAYYLVYQAAVEMLKLPHSQEEVDKMYENLVCAYLNLRLKPSIDTTAPVCTIEYSISELTYDDVAVTITTNEKATIVGEGWNVDSTGKVFTKIYSTNVNEEVILKDAAGNATIVNIKIENIVNKMLLESFVKKCTELQEAKYTDVSWKGYYAIYRDAKEMLKVSHTQIEVDKMYEDLVGAYLGLRLKLDADLIDFND